MQETMEVPLLISRVQRGWAGRSRSEHNLDLKLEGLGTASKLCHLQGLSVWPHTQACGFIKLAFLICSVVLITTMEWLSDATWLLLWPWGNTGIKQPEAQSGYTCPVMPTPGSKAGGVSHLSGCPGVHRGIPSHRKNRLSLKETSTSPTMRLGKHGEEEEEERV